LIHINHKKLFGNIEINQEQDMKKYIGLFIVLLIITVTVGDAVGQSAPAFVHIFFRDSTGQTRTMHDTLLMNKWRTAILTNWGGLFAIDSLIISGNDTLRLLSPISTDSGFVLGDQEFPDTVAIIVTDSLTYYVTKASVRDSIAAVLSDSALITQTELTAQLADSAKTFLKLADARDSTNAVISDSGLVNNTELLQAITDSVSLVRDSLIIVLRDSMALVFDSLYAREDSLWAHTLDSLYAREDSLFAWLVDSMSVATDSLRALEDSLIVWRNDSLKTFLKLADARDSTNAVVSDSSLINQTELTAQIADTSDSKMNLTDDQTKAGDLTFTDTIFASMIRANTAVKDTTTFYDRIQARQGIDGTPNPTGAFKWILHPTTSSDTSFFSSLMIGGVSYPPTRDNAITFSTSVMGMGRALSGYGIFLNYTEPHWSGGDNFQNRFRIGNLDDGADNAGKYGIWGTKYGGFGGATYATRKVNIDSTYGITLDTLKTFNEDTLVLIDPVKFDSGAVFMDSVLIYDGLYVLGKVTTIGGVDPPYVSYSAETYESIREFAKDVTAHEKVMLFYNVNKKRMELYDIEADTFKPLYNNNLGIIAIAIMFIFAMLSLAIIFGRRQK